MNTRLLRIVCATLGVACTAASAPPRVDSGSGTIRVWSSAALGGVVTRWQDGFRRAHPAATFASHPLGSDAAMAALYTGKADIAVMGREPTASEVQAFEWIYRYKPTAVEIISGSLDRAERSPSPVVFVHRDNPLAHLTLSQLDAIFSAEHRRGGTAIRTWGDLGLGGAWATQPIDLYAPDATSGTGLFFRHVVLRDSRKLNWDRLREFSDAETPRTLAALANDRRGIAVARLGDAGPDVKPLAIAADDRGPFVSATAESLAARTYPLTRTVFALVNRAPSHPLNPAVDAFLRYILSDDGQAVGVGEGLHRLPADVVASQEATLAPKIYAQQLVDETAAREPDLVGVALHVTPPKASDNVIVASNVGRIGEKAGPDVLRAMQATTPQVEVADAGTHARVELALNDATGTPVGALELLFPYKRGDDQAALQQRAARIRDGLSREILNTANLLDPYPIDPSVPTKSHAQRLIDRAMAAHPDVISLAMHVTLPNSNENVILGSSFGRIGKKADEDDMKVITSGTTSQGVYAGGTRFGLELALQDAGGKTIGALSVGYRYKNGDDQLALLKRAETLRDELRTQINSVEQLVAVEP